MGTHSSGGSIGSLSPLLFSKFLSNCETNCGHTAGTKIKKAEFVVSLVLKNSFVCLLLTGKANTIALLNKSSINEKGSMGRSIIVSKIYNFYFSGQKQARANYDRSYEKQYPTYS